MRKTVKEMFSLLIYKQGVLRCGTTLRRRRWGEKILYLWFKSTFVHSVAEYVFSSHILRSVGAETDRASLLQSHFLENKLRELSRMNGVNSSLHRFIFSHGHQKGDQWLVYTRHITLKGLKLMG